MTKRPFFLFVCRNPLGTRVPWNTLLEMQEMQMTLIWDGGWNKGEIESINTHNHFSKFTFTAPFEQHSEATEL